MHVLVGIPCLLRGGTEIQTLYLVRALVLFGWKVTVLCYFEYDRQVVDEYSSAGGNVILMKLDRSLGHIAFVRVLRKEIAGQKPDVMHVQYMTPGALAILAARLAGLRRVYATVHQPYSSWHSPLWKILLRLSAPLCDYFISVSLTTEMSWFGRCRNITDISGYKLPGHFTLHNAVDIARVRLLVESGEADALKDRYGLKSGFVFGFIGRLSDEKGLDVLFEAFELLVQRHQSVNLLVIGDGPEKATLLQRYGRRTWWKMVRMPGRLSWEEAMRHFSAMDVAVVPSRFEGFGLSAVEAMAASIPVIASDAGGLAEVIEDGHSGLLFERGNAVALCSEMVRLLTEPEFRKKLVLGASKRVWSFDISRFNDNILKIYKVIEK